jgi:hypothetical protein
MASIGANLVSRGAVAVYGLTSSLYLFTRVQYHKAATQDVHSRLLAEEGKNTALAQELNKTKEQLRVVLEAAPLPHLEPLPQKEASDTANSSTALALGVMLGGGFAVLGGMASALK